MIGAERKDNCLSITYCPILAHLIVLIQCNIPHTKIFYTVTV